MYSSIYAENNRNIVVIEPAAFVGSIIGDYIDKNWPKEALIALNTAGSTPYFAQNHKFIDMIGLNDRHIARRKNIEIILPWQVIPGHLKGDGDYILKRQPDYIIIGPAEGTEVDKFWFFSDYELAQNEEFRRTVRKKRSCY